MLPASCAALDMHLGTEKPAIAVSLIIENVPPPGASRRKTCSEPCGADSLRLTLAGVAAGRFNLLESLAAHLSAHRAHDDVSLVMIRLPGSDKTRTEN